MRLFRILVAAILLANIATAGSIGTFRGTVAEVRDGWIMLRGRNGVGRAVRVASARIVYAEDVPQNHRKARVETHLAPGAQLRITAEQDARGEWVATEIEIIAPQ